MTEKAKFGRRWIRTAVVVGVLCGALVDGTGSRAAEPPVAQADNYNIVEGCVVTISNRTTGKYWTADVNQPGAPVFANNTNPGYREMFTFQASTEPLSYRIWSFGAQKYLVGWDNVPGKPVRADGDGPGSWERVRSEVVSYDPWGWTVRLRSYANDLFMLSRADDPSGAVRANSPTPGQWELVRVVPTYSSDGHCWPHNYRPNE